MKHRRRAVVWLCCVGLMWPAARAWPSASTPPADSGFSAALLAKAGLAVAWESNARCGTVRKVYMAENSIYVESASATLSCLDTRSGWVRWQTNMRRALMFPPMEMGERTGYFSKHYIVVLETKTGEQVSCIPLPRVTPIAPLVYSDGAVYGCSIDDRVFRMDLATGRDVWGIENAKQGRALLEAPVCFKGAVVYVSRVDGGTMHAVNKASGKKLWDYTVGLDLTAPAAFGETVLVGAADGSLYAIDVASKPKESGVTPKWQFTAVGSLFEPVQVVGELGFVPCRDHGIYALDLKDGKQKWFAAGRGVRLLARGKRRAYLGFGDKTIAAVDVDNGKLLWQLVPQRYTIFIPNLRTNMLYLASPDGALIALKER